MKNIDKLTDTLIHVEHVLEQKIPKGYAELVREYQIRELFIGIVLLVLGIALLVTSILLVRYFGKKSDTTDDFLPTLMMCLVIIFVVSAAISILTAIAYLANGLSPNLSMLKMLLHK